MPSFRLARSVAFSLLVLASSVSVIAQPRSAPRAWLDALEVTAGEVQTLSCVDRGGRFTFRIAIDGLLHTVSCRPHSMRAPGFRLLVDGPTGLVPVPAPPPSTCRGSVIGAPGSVVALSRDGNELRGIVRVGQRLLGIHPAAALDPTAGAEQHVVFDAQDNFPSAGTCGSAALGGPVGPAPVAGWQLGNGILSTAEIAIDCDYQFFTANGSNVNATTNDAEAVMNATDAIYVADVGITHMTTALIIRSTNASNPYTTNDPSGLLNEFLTYWNQNHSNIGRDVAHLMTGRNLSGSVIGIAWLNVICNVPMAYGLSQRLGNNLTSRTGLTAHELGHNWAATHCSGTGCQIMCPSLGGCGPITSFGPQAIGTITYVKGNASCLTTPPPPPPLTTHVTEPVRLDAGSASPPSETDGVAVAIEGTRVAAAWADAGSTSGGPRDIHVAVSNDEGLTFAAAVRVDVGDPDHASDAHGPQVVVCQNGAVVCAWEDARDGGVGLEDVGCNRSASGAGWSGVTMLNSSTSGAHVTSGVASLRLAVSANTVYACWLEDSLSAPGSAQELCFTRSLDAGVSWSTPVVLNTQVPGHSNGTYPHNDVDAPVIAVDGDTVAIAFIDDRQVVAGQNQDDVWVAISTDRGASWSESIVESSISGDANEPAIAIDGARVLVAWLDGATAGTYSVHAATTTNAGAFWTPEALLSVNAETTAGANATSPSVGVRGGWLYVAWCDDAVSVNTGGPAGASGSKASMAQSFSGGAIWIWDLAIDGADPRPNNDTDLVVGPHGVHLAMSVGAAGSRELGLAWSRDGIGFNGLDEAAFHGVDVSLTGAARCGYAVDGSTGIVAIGYRDPDSGGNEPYFSSTRLPWLELQGDPLMGNTVTMAVRGVPSSAGTGASFTVGLSSSGTSPGLPTPVGTLHLVWDTLTTASLIDPSLTPNLQGAIDADGDGFGVSTTWPLPSGWPDIHAVAGILDGAGNLIHVTHPLRIVTQ